MARNFFTVTEMAGTAVSQEQIDRLVSRYFWAAHYCAGKDVVEAACGSGVGLGVLTSASRSLEAGDFSSGILAVVRKNYGSRINLYEFDAQEMPFKDCSKDVIILFEAIYYLPEPERFFRECARVLRPRGQVLISTANRDLWDFHPSPYSHRYFNMAELNDHFGRIGFECEAFGFQPITEAPLRQRILRPVKRIASSAGLMPRTMHGKRWLKRIIFGNEVAIPAEIDASTGKYVPPTPIPCEIDRVHKVLYCAATRMAV